MNPNEQTPASSDTDVPGARALTRGLDVLFAVIRAQEPPKFGELQKSLNIPKASLHRLLAALQTRQLVRYDPQVKRYSVGSGIIDFASGSLDRSNLVRSCRPELSRLSRRLGIPACLYVRDDDAVFVLDFENPDASFSSVARVWPRLSIDKSAPGRAILSSLPHSARITGNTDPEFALTKALGYSVQPGDETNNRLVAASVIGASGLPEGAICCEFSGSVEKPGYFHDCGRLISEAARRASSNTTLKGATPVIHRIPLGDIDPRATILETGRDYMGENPLWVPAESKLYWLDILAPSLNWLKPETQEMGREILPEIIGGIAQETDGNLVMVGHNGLYERESASGRLKLLIDPEATKPDNRFNTASVDKFGQLWAGTHALDNSTLQGSMFCIRPDLSFQIPLPTVGLPKNVAWSPDGGTLYFSDGFDRCIWAFDVATDGSLQDKRKFVSGDDSIGVPNGITVDSGGGVWASMLGTWSVRRFLKNGETDEMIVVPTPMPTGLAFGGDDLKTLFVTSTYLRLPPDFAQLAPHAGKLISIDLEIAGMAANKFRSK